MLKKLLITTLFILALVVSIFLIFKTEKFKNYALNQVHTAIEKITDGKVQVAEIDINFPSLISLKNITTDQILIDKIELSLSFKALLQGKMKIKHLLVQDAEILDAKKLKSESVPNLSIPKIPSFFSSFKLENLRIKHLKYQDHLIDAEGSLIFDVESKRLNAHLTLSDPLISEHQIKSFISLTIENQEIAADFFLNHRSDSLKGSLTLDSVSGLELHSVSLNYGSLAQFNSKHLKLQLNPFLIVGKIDGAFQDFSYQDLSSKGKVYFKGFLSSDSNNLQLLKLSFRSKDLKTLNTQFKDIAGNLFISDLYHERKLDFTFFAKEMTENYSKTKYLFSDIYFNTKSFNANSPSTFLINCKEEENLKANIETTGFYQRQEGQFVVFFEHLRGKLFDQRVDLTKNFSLIIKENTVEITPLAAAFGTNSLTASGFIDEESNLLGAFTVEGEIGKVIETYTGSPSIFSGKTMVAIDVEGTLENPHFKGIAAVTSGTFEIPETGSLYKNIEAKFDIVNTDLILKELTASDAFEGVIKGTGVAEINLEKKLPFTLDVEIENAKLLRLDFATATGNGKLSLSGNLKGATLSGKVIAEKARVKIPKKSKAYVPSVDVVYINQDENEVPPTIYEAPVSSWPLHMDLDFLVKNPISMRGKDFKSHWRGSLQVKGTSSQPELFGEFKILDGQYKFRGKIFEIIEGTITLSGDPAKKTSLYIVGSQEIGDIRADVIYKGPLKSPAISFRSNPSLPQKEILSWILFGHGAKDLNAFEGSKLSQSIKDLNTGSSGTDLLTKIRNKIGIDTFDINHNMEGENNDVSIKVGKYVSRGILVSVNKSMSAEANRLEIEAKLFKDIKIQAEVGDDKEGQLNLKWRMDY